MPALLMGRDFSNAALLSVSSQLPSYMESKVRKESISSYGLLHLSTEQIPVGSIELRSSDLVTSAFTQCGNFPGSKERHFLCKLLWVVKLSIENSKRNGQNVITYPPHTHYSPASYLFFIIGITKLWFIGKCVIHFYMFTLILEDFTAWWPG